MLILSRRIGETLVVGEGDNAITVTVLGVEGRSIRLGTKAPDSVPVHRLEIHNRIQLDHGRPPLVMSF